MICNCYERSLICVFSVSYQEKNTIFIGLFSQERSNDGDIFNNEVKSEHEAKLVICSHLKTNYPICFFINLKR